MRSGATNLDNIYSVAARRGSDRNQPVAPGIGC